MTKRVGFRFSPIVALILILFMIPISATSQSLSDGSFENILGKPESEQNGLVVLQFGATGMTESSARVFSSDLAQSIANTNRFTVIPLEEAEEVTASQDPTLLPCFDIGCGIQMGKFMEAEWILTGHISLTPGGSFSLNVKLVLIFDNSLAFEETIRFTDETKDRLFYQLASRIAANAPLIGKILEANNKVAVIDLGEKNGVQVGDQLVIYRDIVVRSDSGEFMTEGGTRRKNIGILKITRVGKSVSEGVYFQTIETPDAGQSVTTFLDRRKQIVLVDNIRKELDTHLRNVFEIKKSVELSPVKLEDMAKQKWVEKVKTLENQKAFWRTFLIGSAAVSAYMLNQFKSGEDYQLMAALGTLGYSSFKFFSIRYELEELKEEGKYKGYLELSVNPELGSIGLNYQFKF